MAPRPAALALFILAAAALTLSAAPASAQDDRNFVIHSEGVGRVRADASADLNAIRRAYAEFELHEATVSAEAPEITMMLGQTKGDPSILLLFEDGFLREATLSSPRFVGPTGARVGAPFGALDLAPPVQCYAAISGVAYRCVSAAEPRIEYVFEGEAGAANEDDPLIAIIWSFEEEARQ